MYQPVLNRFLSRDPLPSEGQPHILYDNNWFGHRMTWMRNTYGYCDNNPMNRIDPSGLQPAGGAGPMKACVECYCEGFYIGAGTSYPIDKIVNCGAEPPDKCCRSICSGMGGPGSEVTYTGNKVLPPTACYAGRFYTCNRPIRKDAAQGCFEKVGIACANVFGHEYLWYNAPGDEYDVGWSMHGNERKGDLPGKEHGGYGDPTRCFECFPDKAATLKYGIGAGKTVKVAGESAILDCIANSPAREDYSLAWYYGDWYHCGTWSKETAEDCGLNC